MPGTSELLTAFVIDPSYVIVDSKPLVRLWCRLSNGESALIEKSFQPYFFIKEKDKQNAQIIAEKVPEAKTMFSDTDSKTMYYHEPTCKVVVIDPSFVPKIRELFEKNTIECFEADIRFAYRAMMDWGVHSVFQLDRKQQSESVPEGIRVDAYFSEPDIIPLAQEEIDTYTSNLSFLSFDIESSKDSGDVYCLSAYGVTPKKEIRTASFIVGDEHLHKKLDKKNVNAKVCATEGELIESFMKLITEWDPDIITGWHVIDFDLAHLYERAKKAKVKFSCARDGKEMRMRIESSFFKDSSAQITGRVVLDGIQLLKNSYVQLDDYKLATAAKSFSDEEKLIQDTGAQKIQEIDRLYKEDPSGLLKYNMLDSKLVMDILEKSGAYPLTMKRSLLVGMPLDRVSASIASFDSLYLRELRARGFVAPSVQARKRDSEGVGGFVMQSKPGIYDNVIVCDFKSLYPSIMRTFNIDPLAFIPDDIVASHKKSALISAPNGAHFSKEVGIVPAIIQRFWAARDETRKRGDEQGRFAIKIHMNSMYGVLASPNCRFFNRTIGNAITSFAKSLIQKSADFVHEHFSYDIIYGDTDSIFVHIAGDDAERANLKGKEVEQALNTFLHAEVEKQYAVPSFLEMEYEKLFVRFVMPTVRGSETGAKKRYAGLLYKGKGLAEEMSFTGLEMVRRDWTDLAKDFQYELYTLVFAKKDVASYVKKYVQNLKSGKLNDKLVYRKALRKNVDEYTKTTPPHVKAAMKLPSMEGLDSDIISYVMTIDGPEPVQNITHEYDYEHYIDKQLRPIADSLLSFYDTNFDDQLSGQSQSSLFDF